MALPDNFEPDSLRPRRTRAAKSRRNTALMFVGGGVALLVLFCGGLAYVGFNKLKNTQIYANQPEFGDPAEPFPIDAYPVPDFSQASSMDLPPVGGCFVRSVNLSAAEPGAGVNMSMRIYIPSGQHADKSLPCVFVPPAGTNLMVGCALDDSSYHDETLPYANAGMIAVAFSLDGECNLETMSNDQLREAYLQFRAAAAGVVNGRNAVDYVLSSVPEADPSKMFVAGHSSAANVSLLLAAHDSRIAGCIAFAPAADVEKDLAEVANDPQAGLLLPRLSDFARQSSPQTHALRFKCPVFLFHAMDDTTTSPQDTRALEQRMLAGGTDVTFQSVPSGGHYQPMISDGIPRAINWLQSKFAVSKSLR